MAKKAHSKTLGRDTTGYGPSLNQTRAEPGQDREKRSGAVVVNPKHLPSFVCVALSRNNVFTAIDPQFQQRNPTAVCTNFARPPEGETRDRVCETVCQAIRRLSAVGPSAPAVKVPLWALAQAVRGGAFKTPFPGEEFSIGSRFGRALAHLITAKFQQTDKKITAAQVAAWGGWTLSSMDRVMEIARSSAPEIEDLSLAQEVTARVPPSTAVEGVSPNKVVSIVRGANTGRRQGPQQAALALG